MTSTGVRRFEQRGAYFDGDHVLAAKKGANMLERGSQVQAMAEFMEILDFPPAPGLDVYGQLDAAAATAGERRGQARRSRLAESRTLHPTCTMGAASRSTIRWSISTSCCGFASTRTRRRTSSPSCERSDRPDYQCCAIGDRSPGTPGHTVEGHETDLDEAWFVALAGAGRVPASAQVLGRQIRGHRGPHDRRGRGPPRLHLTGCRASGASVVVKWGRGSPSLASGPLVDPGRQNRDTKSSGPDRRVRAHVSLTLTSASCTRC
jgi:hypothetical protein